MDAITLKTRFFWLLFSIILISVNTIAQENTPETLSFGIPVSGSASINQPMIWEIRAASGEVLSFYAQATASNSDPIITIRDGNSNVVVSNDDFDYPTRFDALIEGFTVPQTGTYTLEVSSFSNTASNFTLTMFPGYANVAAIDQFTDQVRWQNFDPNSDLTIEGMQSQLQLELSGRLQTATVVSPTGQIPIDSYSKIDFIGIASNENWQVGITFRQQNANTYYAFVVNSEGLWRVILQTQEEIIILRDWTTHNAIVTSEFPFSLGVLTYDNTYEFYFDGEYLGTEEDETLTNSGRTGILLTTANVNESNLQVITDNFLVTTPFNLNGASITPQQVVGQTAQDIIQELQRRKFVPTGGELGASIGEGFIQFAQAGVTRLPIVREQSYSSIAFGADITINTSDDTLHGCGLTFHEVEDTTYSLAYVDNQGGYGISQFSNDIFEPGIFGERDLSNPTNQHLIVISQPDMTYFYVNRLYAGSTNLSINSGGINNAVINFEPADTTCTFRDIWVWRWE